MKDDHFFIGAFIGALIIYLLIRWHKLKVAGSLGCGCNGSTAVDTGQAVVSAAKSSCGGGAGPGVTFTAPLTVAQTLQPIPSGAMPSKASFIRPRYYFL